MDTPTTEQEETQQAAPDSEQPVAPVDEDESPEVIFFQAVAEIPTQPLPRQQTPQEHTQERRVLLLILLVFLSFVGGSVLAVVTYPTATIAVTPISTSVSSTARLALPTRTLKPASVSQTQSAPTTGRGSQKATRATGILTFYNGQAGPQTVGGGTVFTASTGIQVVTAQAVTIPGASPPYLGEATAPAHAAQAGSSGNLPANAVDTTGSLFVKNLTPFAGGRNARAYRAVAQRDLDRVTATLNRQLRQALPQAFSLPAGEALYLTHCTFTASPNHPEGAEAQTVTVTAKETCAGVAYQQDALQQAATTVFTKKTRPGRNYMLVGTVTPTVTGVSPLTVSIRGLWVYRLSEDDQQLFAQHLAGDSPQQARTYLLHTGVIVRVSVSGPLPKDPGHIHFVELVEG